ncbi:MAG: cell division FtsA domain-containing protein [Fusobacteria bacterium]|nr:cell division FtsA domain-containing protein [Fusobacteriota bacterium]
MGEKEIVGFIDVGSYKLKGLLVSVDKAAQELDYIEYFTKLLDGESQLKDKKYENLERNLEEFITKLSNSSKVLEGKEISKLFFNVKAVKTETDIIEDERMSTKESHITQEYLKNVQENYYNDEYYVQKNIIGSSFWNIKVDGMNISEYMNYKFNRTFSFRFSLFYTQMDEKIQAVFNVMRTWSQCKPTCSINTMSTSKILLKEREIQNGVIVVDIGEVCTEISLYRFNKLIFVKTISIGGYHVTKDIKELLKLTFEQAENLKIHYNRYLKVDGTKILVNFPIQNKGEAEHFFVVEKKHLEAIIESRMEDIFELTIKALRSAGFAHEKIASYIFTGGSSEFDKVTEWAERYFNSPKVKRINATTKMEWKTLNSQESTALVGMSAEYALHFLEEQNEEQVVPKNKEIEKQEVEEIVAERRVVKPPKVKRVKIKKQKGEGLFTKLKNKAKKTLEEVF